MFKSVIFMYTVKYDKSLSRGDGQISGNMKYIFEQ